MPGADLCIHNSHVKSWAELPGDDHIIIGGYESGVDAAVNLAKAGKKCSVLASTPCWHAKTTDPSAELAPYTAMRLRDVLAPGFSPQPKLFSSLRVLNVRKVEGGDRGEEEEEGYYVTAEWKKEDEAMKGPNLRMLVNRDIEEEPHGLEGTTLVLHTPNPPVLCTGFEGSVAASASHLFDFKEADDPNSSSSGSGSGSKNESGQAGCLEGAPLITKNDESTKVPGVFLVGPAVNHGSLSFCFVYKFRQRFAIVCKAICDGLGRDTSDAVKVCRQTNMFLDDFACCEDTCGDVC